jgi:hypothetical protein
MSLYGAKLYAGESLSNIVNDIFICDRGKVLLIGLMLAITLPMHFDTPEHAPVKLPKLGLRTQSSSKK